MLDLVLILTSLAAGGGQSETAAGPEQGAQMQLAAGQSSEQTATGSKNTGNVPAGDAGFKAEEQIATGRFLTALEVKPILGATRGSWVAVREFNGLDLVYVTQIWSWRCGLVGMKFGVNGAEPEPWPLPDCHKDIPAPNSILPEDGQPYLTFELGSVRTVTVELIYDDLSRDSATFDRQGVLLP